MHHDKAVSVFNSVAQIVCDHDCCDLLLCHNLACELHYNLSGLWIEGCCVLIKDEELDWIHRSHEKRKCLPLTARKCPNLCVKLILKSEV